MIFTQRYERTVDRDNTVHFNNLVMQLERAHWRHTLAGCKAIIHQHLDTTLTLMIAGHRIGHYSAQGTLLTPLSKKQIKAVEKTFPPPLRLLLNDSVTDQTGHFTCLEKRTFLYLLTTLTSRRLSAVRTKPQAPRSLRCWLTSSFEAGIVCESQEVTHCDSSSQNDARRARAS